MTKNVNETTLKEVTEQKAIPISEELATDQLYVLNKLTDAGIDCVKLTLSKQFGEMDVDDIIMTPECYINKMTSHFDEMTLHTFLLGEIEMLALDLVDSLGISFDESEEGGRGELTIHVASGGCMDLKTFSFYSTTEDSEPITGPIDTVLRSYFKGASPFDEFTPSQRRHDYDDIKRIFNRLSEQGVASVLAFYENQPNKGSVFDYTLYDQNQQEFVDVKQLSSNGLALTEYVPVQDLQPKATQNKGEQKWLNQTIVFDNMKELLDRVLRGMVSSAHPGYESDVGGGGSLAINVDDMSVTHRYRETVHKMSFQTHHFGPPFSALAQDRPLGQRLKG